MISILDLSPDLLVTVIPQYLRPEETFEFSILNKALYDIFYDSPLTTSLYKTFYNKKFTNNSQDFQLINDVDLNWIALFKSRVNLNQKVYTWGSSEFGRLGYLINLLPNSSALTNSVHSGSLGVHTPTNLSNFNHNIIVDIIANGFSFIILTNQGELYYTGASWKRSRYNAPGPFEQKDFQPLPVVNFTQGNLPHRRSLRGSGGVFILPFARRYDDNTPTENVGARGRLPRLTNPNLTLPPEQQAKIPELAAQAPHEGTIKESNFITKLNIPTGVKIVSISTGREHILALDSKNNLYTWDTGTNDTTGVKLQLPNLDNLHNILKIFAGWNLSGCYVNGVGIIVWYSREAVTKEKYESGEPVNVHSFTIPGTANDIVDFVIGDSYILYIKSGKLYRLSGINLNELSKQQSLGNPISNAHFFMGLQPMDNFNNWLEKYNKDHDTSSSFVKLNNCYYSFVVFTNDDQVLFGGREHVEESEVEPTVIPELQNQNIKQIEIGDYHYLALTKEGNVLSWGVESKNCGCLGLGNSKDFVANLMEDIVEDSPGGIRVHKPVEIVNPPYPGKWVSITARGWHSGGIYIASEQD